jgi:hypothetical protein
MKRVTQSSMVGRQWSSIPTYVRNEHRLCAAIGSEAH